MSISTTLFSEILHASLFFTGQLRNPWQMLAEPWGSAEPRLKITGLVKQKLHALLIIYYCYWFCRFLSVSVMLMLSCCMC